MIGEIIGVTKLCVQLAPSFVLIGLGLIYLFYNADGWNLDRIYEKYFHGRYKKNYAAFTQRTGLALLVLGLLYSWLVVWPVVQEFFEKKPT